MGLCHSRTALVIFVFLIRTFGGQLSSLCKTLARHGAADVEQVADKYETI